LIKNFGSDIFEARAADTQLEDIDLCQLTAGLTSIKSAENFFPMLLPERLSESLKRAKGDLRTRKRHSHSNLRLVRD
jgi:hypothetical protein